MFNNFELPKEIFYYSIIPVGIIALIILVLLLIGKKKYDNYYKYNYFMKTLMLVIIGLVLPLIVGYTIWILERFINKSIISSNILYILLLIALIVLLVVLLIVICRKLIKSINGSENLSEVE